MVPTIQTIEVRPVIFDLVRPFVTAAGEKSQTDNVQIHLVLSNGKKGYGEASSSLAMPQESPAALSEALRALVPELRGMPIDAYRELVHACWRLQPFHPTAAAAMECAILDAYARWKGRALFEFLGGMKKAVETDLTLSIGDPDSLARSARSAAREGFHQLKIKLAGDSAEKDAERVIAVHRAVPRAALVADGNQGMNLTQAIRFCRALEKAQVRLVFLEQPFPRHDWQSMRLFRKRGRLPLFADESVLTSADAVRVLESKAADGINIKVAKSGLLGALDILHTVQRFRNRAPAGAVGLAIGCMEESKLGLAPSVHLACGTGVFDWVDLDSVYLLKEKSRVRGGFRMEGPHLSVAGIRSGIGIW